MHAGRILAGLAFATLFLIGTAGGVSAQEYTRKQWWPTERGPDDQLGALNRLTPAKVLEASRLIRTGTIYDMTFVYEESMPLFSLTPFRRKYTLLVPGGPTYGATGENKLFWNEDYISGHVTQGLFTRASAVQIGGPALGPDFPTVNTFSGNGALNNAGGILAFLGSSLVVRDAVISGNSGPGLIFSLRSQGQMFNSTIQNNSGDGIRLIFGSALLPAMPASTVSGNSGFGIQCTDPESSILNTIPPPPPFPPFFVFFGNTLGDVSAGCSGF
jgi:hypothetical protein